MDSLCFRMKLKIYRNGIRKMKKLQEEIIQFFAAVTMDLRRTNEIQRQKINQQEKTNQTAGKEGK